MGIISLVDQSGTTHRLQAAEGWRVMEIIRDSGFAIAAECGGAGACATCHVYVAPQWATRLHGPLDDEEERLDTVTDYTANSRLSCQIIWTEDLDGLQLSLPISGVAPLAETVSPEAVLP